MRGLTSTEAERSLEQTFTVHDRKINDESLHYLQSVKRNIIKQTGIMEFHEPETSFSDIGGLTNLVEDLILRCGEFEESAQQAGIKSPKGCLLVGLPGTGKSLIAQSVAGEWKMPMLEFNMANVLDSYVGSSEQNMKSTAVAESMAPCVLMVDEIDKALSGFGYNWRRFRDHTTCHWQFLDLAQRQKSRCIRHCNGQRFVRNCPSHA